MISNAARSFRVAWAPVVVLCVGVLYVTLASGQDSGSRSGEWRAYGGAPGAMKYSPLDQINKDNVAQLRVAWREPSIDPASVDPQFRSFLSGRSRSSAVMANGVLYSANGMGLVVAMNPGTGKTIWTETIGEGDKPGGGSNRSIGYWEEGNEARIINYRNHYLYALDAKTGKAIPGFGTNGRVDLNAGLLFKGEYHYGGPPLIARDAIVMGSGMGEQDRPTEIEGEPGTVRAYDVRTGRIRWTFYIIPREGDPATKTWENDSWRYTGAGNVWGPMSADDELGYVYAGTTSAANNYYGAARHGDNLYTNSLVCLDVKTGRVVWYRQLIHHDIFDYDNNAASVLTDITVNGRKIKAVVILGKQAFAYVYDRVTGEPVWPIVERRVESSTVPGEKAARTQPVPTKPPPFDRQGITPDDLIDFTPELRAQGLEISKKYRLGPLFTPPSVMDKDFLGTIVVPGLVGGAAATGAAFDPETATLYVPSFTQPYVVGLGPGDPNKTRIRYAAMPNAIEGTSTFGIPAGPQGLPLMKPPYGRITAIDLNRGAHVWMVPNADGPRDHPAIKHLNLGPLGVPSKTSALVTKTLLFTAEAEVVSFNNFPPRGAFPAPQFRALDKATGKTLWQFDLEAPSAGAPITYMYQGNQYVVVRSKGELVALALPGRSPSQ